MGILRRLLATTRARQVDDSRPVLEWLGRDESAVQLGRVQYLDVLLADLKETLPAGAVLVLEGKPAPDVREFLDRTRIEPEVQVERGTTWPKQEFFHVPATRENLDVLLNLMLNHAVSEICDHLVVYRGERVLLWVHDAGDGYVYAHPSLGEQNLERIRSRLLPR